MPSFPIDCFHIIRAKIFEEAKECYSGTIFVSEFYHIYFVYVTPISIKLIMVSFLCLITPDQCCVIISPLFG